MDVATDEHKEHGLFTRIYNHQQHNYQRTLLLHSCTPKAIRALVFQKSTTRKLNHKGMDLATDEHKEIMNCTKKIPL